MPKLTDIAIMKFGKTIIADTTRGMYTLRRQLPKEELSLANRLRTTVNIGNENNLKGLEHLAESKGVYASWRSELEREPHFDLCEKTPLNTVKDTTKEDFTDFILDIKHKEWLKAVDERMKKLGFKP